MPTLTTLAPDAPMDEINACIARDGAVILRDVLSADQLARVKAELMPYLDATENGTDEFHGKSTTRTGALMARSAMCRDMALNEKTLGVCDNVLLENCERYQIHVTQAIRIRPGESVQPIHKDKWAWGKHTESFEPQISTMWAITDFTAENGATTVVPGSDNWPNDRQPKDEETTQAVMTAGSVMIFTGSVLHGGSANTSDGDRIGLLIDYTVGWLRQEENQYLCCPPELAKDYNPLLRRLLGYDMATFTLGYYSPPCAPGEGPEVVSPEYAVDPTITVQTAGGEELAEALIKDIAGDAPTDVIGTAAE